MKLIDLQRNNKLKLIFETLESEIDFYKVYDKKKILSLRNLAQKVVNAFKSTYACKLFFFENEICET